MWLPLIIHLKEKEIILFCLFPVGHSRHSTPYEHIVVSHTTQTKPINFTPLLPPHQPSEKMENGSIKKQSNQQLQAMVNHNLSSTTTTAAADLTIRGIMTSLRENINKNDPRPTVHLGHGDPSTFLPFRTATVAEDAVVDALRTGNYNCYSTTAGILPARR